MFGGNTLYYLLVLPLVAIQALTPEQKGQFGNDPTRAAEGTCVPWVYLRQETGDTPSFTIFSNGVPEKPKSGYQKCNGDDATEQNHVFTIPDRPLLRPRAKGPSGRYCVGTVVGVMTDGLPLYNGQNIQVQNIKGVGVAVEENVFEGVPEYWGFNDCDRHASSSDGAGALHYKYASRCLNNNDFMGVALDGHAIYRQSPPGTVLDVCHGAMHDVTDQAGDVIGREYRYYMDFTFPYGPACFRSDVIDEKKNTATCDGQKSNQLCTCDNNAYIGENDCDEDHKGGDSPRMRKQARNSLRMPRRKRLRMPRGIRCSPFICATIYERVRRTVDIVSATLHSATTYPEFSAHRDACQRLDVAICPYLAAPDGCPSEGHKGRQGGQVDVGGPDGGQTGPPSGGS